MAMQVSILILDEIAKIKEVVNKNEDFTAFIDVSRGMIAKLLGFNVRKLNNINNIKKSTGE